jgi:hypothetical protein
MVARGGGARCGAAAWEGRAGARARPSAPAGRGRPGLRALCVRLGGQLRKRAAVSRGARWGLRLRPRPCPASTRPAARAALGPFTKIGIIPHTSALERWCSAAGGAAARACVRRREPCRRAHIPLEGVVAGDGGDGGVVAERARSARLARCCCGGCCEIALSIWPPSSARPLRQAGRQAGRHAGRQTRRATPRCIQPRPAAAARHHGTSGTIAAARCPAPTLVPGQHVQPPVASLRRAAGSLQPPGTPRDRISPRACPHPNRGSAQSGRSAIAAGNCNPPPLRAEPQQPRAQSCPAARWAASPSSCESRSPARRAAARPSRGPLRPAAWDPSREPIAPAGGRGSLPRCRSGDRAASVASARAAVHGAARALLGPRARSLGGGRRSRVAPFSIGLRHGSSTR